MLPPLPLVAFLLGAMGSTRSKMSRVPEVPQKKPIITQVVSAIRKPVSEPLDESMTCERCGADMYRMHAVWRCPACRFKTDCCGW